MQDPDRGSNVFVSVMRTRRESHVLRRCFPRSCLGHWLCRCAGSGCIETHVENISSQGFKTVVEKGDGPGSDAKIFIPESPAEVFKSLAVCDAFSAFAEDWIGASSAGHVSSQGGSGWLSKVMPAKVWEEKVCSSPVHMYERPWDPPELISAMLARSSLRTGLVG